MKDYLLQFFSFAHLPEHMQTVSKPFHDLAHEIVAKCPMNPERTVALRKLLEAKDCAVRSLIFKAEEKTPVAKVEERKLKHLKTAKLYGKDVYAYSIPQVMVSETAVRKLCDMVGQNTGVAAHYFREYMTNEFNIAFETTDKEKLFMIEDVMEKMEFV